LPASKILPEVVNLGLESAVLLREFVQHNVFARAPLVAGSQQSESALTTDYWLPIFKKRAPSAPTEIIAHRYANQSPCRV